MQVWLIIDTSLQSYIVVWYWFSHYIFRSIPFSAFLYNHVDSDTENARLCQEARENDTQLHCRKVLGHRDDFYTLLILKQRWKLTSSILTGEGISIQLLLNAHDVSNWCTSKLVFAQALSLKINFRLSILRHTAFWRISSLEVAIEHISINRPTISWNSVSITLLRL